MVIKHSVCANWCNVYCKMFYVSSLLIGQIHISRLLIGQDGNVNCRIMSKIDCDKPNLSKTSYAAVILMS